MSDDRTVLGGRDVDAEELHDWRLLLGALHARFGTGSFATGLQLVNDIGAAAEEADHHPDIDLTYPRVHVRLSSHDVGGVTQRDVRLARRISQLAADAGATPEPQSTSVLELALDTPDAAEIRPFWGALLGYDVPDDPDDEVRDPDGTGPTIWFQATDRHETPRQRWHLDLRVPPEVAEIRIRQALDAGGTLVSDEDAPSYWVLADPQGNRACITTWQGRDGG